MFLKNLIRQSNLGLGWPEMAKLPSIFNVNQKKCYYIVIVFDQRFAKLGVEYGQILTNLTFETLTDSLNSQIKKTSYIQLSIVSL